jgi:hypothetical protein
MKHLSFFTFLLILFVFSKGYLSAQTDSLVLNNDDVIVGEIKIMERGVLTVGTSYSNKDFEIDWEDIREIYTTNYFYFTFAGGKRYYGWIQSTDSVVEIIAKDSSVIQAEKKEIIKFIPVSSGFKYRFIAQIDLGFGLARANNLRQFTAGGKVGYNAEHWRTYITGSALNSIQDSADPIRRADVEWVLKYIFYNDWYLKPSVTYLNSTELQLNSRWNIQLGIGNFLIRSYKAYWGVVAGVNRNIEDYFGDSMDRDSWEGFLSTELNLYGIGDLKLNTKATAYPGFTELGRWRFDWRINMRYSLPLDFYLKLEFVLNYDNQPIEGASDIDYVSTINFGWVWDKN